MYHIFIIHSLTEGHLGRFHFLTIVNRSAINMVEQVSVEQEVEFFDLTPRSDTAGYKFIFSRLKLLHIHFQSGCASFQSQ